MRRPLRTRASTSRLFLAGRRLSLLHQPFSTKADQGFFCFRGRPGTSGRVAGPALGLCRSCWSSRTHRRGPTAVAPRRRPRGRRDCRNSWSRTWSGCSDGARERGRAGRRQRHGSHVLAQDERGPKGRSRPRTHQRGPASLQKVNFSSSSNAWAVTYAFLTDTPPTSSSRCCTSPLRVGELAPYGLQARSEAITSPQVASHLPTSRGYSERPAT